MAERHVKDFTAAVTNQVPVTCDYQMCIQAYHTLIFIGYLRSYINKTLFL